MRGSRVALPSADPDPLPEGHEPLGGARFAGYVEQSLGGSKTVLFLRWCLEDARLAIPTAPGHVVPDIVCAAEVRFVDPEERRRFCRDLVDKALGIGPEEHPDAAHGFVWHPETVVFGPANRMPIDDIVEAARIADGGEGVAEPEEFGRCYALSACGHGASWFDRHADFDLKSVSFEYAGPAVGHEPSVDQAYAPRI
jgi:hypothetical protein